MNSETLHTFVQLANYKNFTQTAGKLYVAQSTVTNRILELENELGRQLILRSKKQLALTAEGEHFLAYAKRILELENQAVKEIGALQRFEHSLRIGSTNTIYDCYLADDTVAFVQSHPEIKFNIILSHSLPLLQMLSDRTIDLAFTFVPSHKQNITCQVFRTEALVLVTGRFDTVYKEGITKAQLAGLPYYYCDFNFQDMGSYIRDLFPKGHSFPLEIDRSANLLPYLILGQGYSFLPESLIKKELETSALIKIPLLDFTIPKVSSYVVALKESFDYKCLQGYLDAVNG
jgi:LysR family transcriptional repressor of citA